MKLLTVVAAILVLLFGLQVLGSVALKSVLDSPVHIDYRILPTLGLIIVAVPVLITKILADARVREGLEAKKDESETQRNAREDDRVGRNPRETGEQRRYKP